MPATASDLAAYRQAQNDIVTLAYQALLSFWNSLDTANPVAAVLALEEFLPQLVQTYGEIGATVAADFYDELRAQSPAVATAYHAILGDAVPIEAVTTSVRWALAPLFKKETPDPQAALGRVTSITNRFVQAQGRQTIVTNVARDPARARFARVPSGATTCAFCLTLASRGAVYATDEAAAHKYHSHCDCVPTPIWSESDYPEGYDPQALTAVYKQARKASDGSLTGPDGVLAAMREQQGIK